jgi:transporter family-2 protein
MLATLLTLALGVLGGIAVGLQSPIAGALAQRLGGAAGSLIVHISGAVLSGLLLLLRGGENIRDWRTVPPYMLGAGALGVVLYLTLSYTLPKLGAAAALTLIIVGQLVMGALIDHFGWFGAAVRPLDGGKLLAMLLVIAGAYLLIR